MKYQNQERAQCKESKGDIGREERQGYRWSQTLSTPWDYQQPTNAKIIMISNKRENMFCVDFGIISNGALYNNVHVLQILTSQELECCPGHYLTVSHLTPQWHDSIFAICQ